MKNINKFWLTLTILPLIFCPYFAFTATTLLGKMFYSTMFVGNTGNLLNLLGLPIPTLYDLYTAYKVRNHRHKAKILTANKEEFMSYSEFDELLSSALVPIVVIIDFEEYKGKTKIVGSTLSLLPQSISPKTVTVDAELTIFTMTINKEQETYLKEHSDNTSACTIGIDAFRNFLKNKMRKQIIDEVLATL